MIKNLIPNIAQYHTQEMTSKLKNKKETIKHVNAIEWQAQ